MNIFISLAAFFDVTAPCRALRSMHFPPCHAFTFSIVLARDRRYIHVQLLALSDLHLFYSVGKGLEMHVQFSALSPSPFL